MSHFASTAGAVAVAVGLVGVGFVPSRVGSAARAADKPVAPPTLGEEPPGEKEVIAKLAAKQVEIMKAQNRPTVRGQHFKGHGCVTAEFAVRADVPPEYRVGLFKESRTYRATVRFSNGGSTDDTVPDVHGMAVKVPGVKGPRAVPGDGREEQDFVLVDQKVFFAPDPQTVLDLLSIRTPADRQAFAAAHPESAKLFAASRRVIASPLAETYRSVVPFKLGGRAVQYAAVPVSDAGAGGAAAATKDHLRTVMAARLSAGKPPVTFDLCVIPQTDPETTPVENPTKEWKATPVPVARVTIGPQTFDAPEQLAACEAMVLDPWNSLADHMPLGAINRARKVVYEESVKTRQGR